MRIGICQIDPTVGDLESNARLILEFATRAREAGCNLAVYPEMALTGYPPEDLLLNRSFVERTAEALDRIAVAFEGMAGLVGTVESRPEGLFNSVAVVADGRVHGHARKCRLPNYGVFDERRYFTAADSASIVRIDGIDIGVSVCEDIWFAGSPSSEARAAGASLLINCSASPFHAGKGAERLEVLRRRTGEHGLPIVYAALAGGQDELLFDGQSLVVAADGSVIARGHQFSEDLVVVDVELVATGPADDEGNGIVPVATIETAALASHPTDTTPIRPALEGTEEIEAALQMGLRAYVDKNGFNGVVLGVSGGIDSAVVATLAVDALGAERVHAAVMPSPWSSSETQADARLLCANLGIDLHELPIGPAMDVFDSTLSEVPEGPGIALANENIQARIRGNLLMALSNRHGWLVVTTGNKSELAVGYSTLYGDAAGGFGLLKDVPKGLVYELATLRNSRPDSPIPGSIITRAPSAELRPGQKDEDSLPPYGVLDEVLRLHVEEQLDVEAIAALGHDRATVERVLLMVDRAEYKRRQYPPGVKITPLAFGRDRRMPMTNGFRS